jgi:hypothetical protein
MLCYFEMPRKTARRPTVPRRAGGVAAQGLANRPGRRHFSSPGQTYAAERFSVIRVALVSAAVGRRLALPMMVILTPSFDGTGPVRSPGYLIRFNRCICGWLHQLSNDARAPDQIGQSAGLPRRAAPKRHSGCCQRRSPSAAELMKHTCPRCASVAIDSDCIDALGDPARQI